MSTTIQKNASCKTQSLAGCAGERMLRAGGTKASTLLVLHYAFFCLLVFFKPCDNKRAQKRSLAGLAARIFLPALVFFKPCDNKRHKKKSRWLCTTHFSA